MRKCVRCQIVFHSISRLYCLYCDSRLMDADVDDFFQTPGVSAKETILTSKEEKTAERVQYLVGSYFRKKSFPFVYSLHRSQFKMGEQFKGFLVQPIDFSSLIRIPWIIIDIFDSFMLRALYTGYCPRCQWKYVKISAQEGHGEAECEYNQEYTSILHDILNGDIIKTEEEFERGAVKKIKAGKRSAYVDLCFRKRDFEAFLDIVTILFSMALILYVLARLVMPIFGAIYDF